MSSSRDEWKHVERLANRVDVITDRLDTLATTISTTAAAIAKKDGELANLRRELEDGRVRVETLVATAGNGAGAEAEIRELRRAVTSLAAERSRPVGDKQLRELDAKVALLARRVETLAATVSATASGLAGRDGELAAIKRSLAVARPAAGHVDEALRRRVEDLASSAATSIVRLQTQADELGCLRQDVDERVGGIAEDVAALAGRLDRLATEVGATTSDLAERERELDALRRHVADTSSRLAAIADDLGAVLGAIPLVAQSDGLQSEAIARVERRLDQVLAGQQTTAAHVRGELEQALAGLSARIDEIERSGSAVGAELARARALWPTVLRSLEARVTELVRAQGELGAEPGDDALSLATESNGSVEPMPWAADPSTGEPDRWAASEEPSGGAGSFLDEPGPEDDAHESTLLLRAGVVRLRPPEP